VLCAQVEGEWDYDEESGVVTVTLQQGEDDDEHDDDEDDDDGGSVGLPWGACAEACSTNLAPPHG
jgi:hypothetical protein